MRRMPVPADYNLEHWNVSGLGYVKHVDCDRDTGRVQEYRGNMSCVCYLHSKCSMLRTARRYSKEYMLDWLVRAIPCREGATTDEKVAAGKAHKAAFVAIP